MIHTHLAKLNKILQCLMIVFLAAPGTLFAHSTIKVIMQLDWIYNVQFAGLYQAVEQGYYEEKGLDVEIRAAARGLKTVPAVLSEEVVFGSAESNVLLKAHAEGAPIRIVGTMFQQSPIGWMYLKDSGIESLNDLAGKRVGIHPDGEKILQLVTAGADVSLDDFTLPKVGYDINILIEGQIDAMQCYAIDEFVRLQIATGGEAGIIMAKDHGYSAYSQMIFTTSAMVEKHPQIVRSFLEATQAGWQYALENPGETVDLLIKQYNPEIDREYQLASLKQIDGLVRENGKNPLYPVNADVLEKSMRMYLEAGILEKDTDVSNLLDLRFNPLP